MGTKNMIATLQIYIHIRKGVEVQIAEPRTRKQTFLLIEAFQVARSWLNQHNCKTIYK